MAHLPDLTLDLLQGAVGGPGPLPFASASRKEHCLSTCYRCSLCPDPLLIIFRTPGNLQSNARPTHGRPVPAKAGGDRAHRARGRRSPLKQYLLLVSPRAGAWPSATEGRGPVGCGEPGTVTPPR